MMRLAFDSSFYTLITSRFPTIFLIEIQSDGR